ncbi:Hypothetical_protein [Hexamita inflata]|uniref:Hypothetical_protein n=1 Tax=Hexamita inflata TaxID=28002 RepID=A0AA86PTJ1_9EUKA|nr:Hypothetical protein HINF_LOCUS33574 [Hexamita inflata]CAI9945936.1 Hypothetical protein HINF_LOCUS33581 [Hexamita inflata]
MIQVSESKHYIFGNAQVSPIGKLAYSIVYKMKLNRKQNFETSLMNSQDSISYQIHSNHTSFDAHCHQLKIQHRLQRYDSLSSVVSQCSLLFELVCFMEEFILDPSNVINILNPDITLHELKDLKQFSKNIISNIVVEVANEGPSPSNIVLGPTHNSYSQQRLAFIIEAAKFNMVKAQHFENWSYILQFKQKPQRASLYQYTYIRMQQDSAQIQTAHLQLFLKLLKTLTFTNLLNYHSSTLITLQFRILKIMLKYQQQLELSLINLLSIKTLGTPLIHYIQKIIDYLLELSSSRNTLSYFKTSTLSKYSQSKRSIQF